MNTTFDFENSWKYDYPSYAHKRFLNSLMQNLNNEQSYHTIKNQTVLNKRFDVEKKIIDWPVWTRCLALVSFAKRRLSYSSVVTSFICTNTITKVTNINTIVTTDRFTVILIAKICVFRARKIRRTTRDTPFDHIFANRENRNFDEESSKISNARSGKFEYRNRVPNANPRILLKTR